MYKKELILEAYKENILTESNRLTRELYNKRKSTRENALKAEAEYDDLINKHHRYKDMLNDPNISDKVKTIISNKIVKLKDDIKQKSNEMDELWDSTYSQGITSLQQGKKIAKKISQGELSKNDIKDGNVDYDTGKSYKSQTNIKYKINKNRQEREPGLYSKYDKK